LSALPLLSIGMPVYNGERYLAEALDSVLRQDYPNLEILIADNASTDATPAICRRYTADARVRYERNAETIEPNANFRRALSMARGRYFTWLAHDDVLRSDAYASTLVERLEANPDAVLCASALELFRDEDSSARSILSYPQFATGEPWAVVRRALFRWPPRDWETLVYGVFRRDILLRHFHENPTFQFPLQKLAFSGRFLVEPSPLRAYRLREGSVGRQRVAKSPFALFVKGVSLKRRLLVTALRSPAPVAERIPPVAVAMSNFFREHLAWAYTVGRQIAALEAELTMLAAVAEERAALVRRLDAELHAIAGGDAPFQRSPGAANSIVRRPAIPRPRRLNPFRSPDSEDANYLNDLTLRVADARRTCHDLLAAIDARDSELKAIRVRASGS
jgi:glycosyltransferase involved in cell wall biosynthesis